MKKIKGFTPLEIFSNRAVKIKSKGFLTGFTIIELLVVIAVIGLLASMTFVALGSARDKGKDSAIMQELFQIRAISRMILTDNGSYESLCDTDDNTLNDSSYPVLKQIEDEVVNLSPGSSPVNCYAIADSYCARADLNVNIGTGYFCVDSRGIASTTDTDCTAGTPLCH